MSLKKKPTPGLCHWTRCQTKVNGTDTLCAKHSAGALVDNAILAKRNEALELLDAAANVPLDAVVELDGAEISGLEFLGRAREHARVMRKELEDLRKADKAPHLAKCQEVDGLYKPATDTCTAVVKACTDRLEEHVRSQNLARLEALKAVQIAASTGDTALVKVEHERAQSLSAALPAQVRTYFDIEPVVDLEGVSPEYHVLYEYLDLDKLKALGKSTQGTAVVPGIKWSRVEKVRTA